MMIAMPIGCVKLVRNGPRPTIDLFQEEMRSMSILSKALAASSFILFTNFAVACDKPASPSLPDPDTAVTPQMIKAKNDVKTYLASAEAYLKCNISTKQHNGMVDDMKSVADGFNKIVRSYKARMAG